MACESYISPWKVFQLMGGSMLYFCFLCLLRVTRNKGRVFYILTPLSCFFFIAIFIVINYTNIEEILVLFQPSSGYLRFAINRAMMSDLSDFSLIFGKGFGSSWKPFYVADLHPIEFEFYFEEMFPHSGMVVLLYEYGVLGLAAFGFFMVKYLLLPHNYAKRIYKDSIGSRSFSSWLWLWLLLFFLLQNGLYVQGVPSGDIYFQSNSLLYVVFAWLIIKARTRCFRAPSSQSSEVTI